MPIGKDWNTSNVFDIMTAPKISAKAGIIIEPIKYVKPQQTSRPKNLFRPNSKRKLKPKPQSTENN